MSDTQKVGHAPLPWEAIEHGEPGSGWWSILRGAWDVSHNGATEPGVVADSHYSAMTPTENEANARFMVKAVNHHEELVEMVREFLAVSSERELDSLWTKAESILDKLDAEVSDA